MKSGLNDNKWEKLNQNNKKVSNPTKLKVGTSIELKRDMDGHAHFYTLTSINNSFLSGITNNSFSSLLPNDAPPGWMLASWNHQKV